MSKMVPPLFLAGICILFFCNFPLALVVGKSLRRCRLHFSQDGGTILLQSEAKPRMLRGKRGGVPSTDRADDAEAGPEEGRGDLRSRTLNGFPGGFPFDEEEV
jgi:hypothetical protein